MKYVPHPYQRRAHEFVKQHKRCALHMDVGTGKTASTISACKDLLESYDIRGVMVFAPLRVATIAWPEEFRKWEEFHHLHFTIVRGSDKDRIKQMNKPASFYLLNYDLMPWWVEWMAQEVRNKRKEFNFDMLVLDESSRLKSSSSSRFRHLKPLSDSSLFPRMVELTGTPAPENYEDLWSQYRLLDHGQRLEHYVTHFRTKYFETNPYNQFELKLRPDAQEQIQQQISDITFTIRAEEHLQMPKIMENTIHVDLPDDVKKFYKTIEKSMVADLNNTTIVASSAAIVSEKCRQVVSGAVYDENGTTHRLHEVKFDALDELLDGNPGNLLVAYWYKHEFETIRSRYPKAPVLGPNMTDAEALRIVRLWNEKKIPLLFAHPASVGHGINLQHGGHHLVWLTTPWSNEICQQFNGRLYRQGQSEHVTIHRIIMRGTIDPLVEQAIKNKEFSQQSLRKALATLQGTT
jgi:SNF2 family DNA or RNA helicase